MTDVAEAAGVSRATAYRYFPEPGRSRPCGRRRGARADPRAGPRSRPTRASGSRICCRPRCRASSSSRRPSRRRSSSRSSSGRATRPGRSARNRRSSAAIASSCCSRPLRRCKKTLPRAQFLRLAKALSLVYGLEMVIILKDLWGLEVDEVRSVGAVGGAGIGQGGGQRGCQQEETTGKIALPPG